MHKPTNLLAAVCLSLISLADAEPARPNILLILADDLGYADVGANGWSNLEYDTPNIDRIFNGGARFLAGYVTNSVCAPSRAGLITGRFGSRFGFDANLGTLSTPSNDVGLDPGQRTMADVLKTVAYKTFAIGKWHLGENDSLFSPNVRGFDEFYGLRSGSRTYWRMSSYDQEKSLIHNGTQVSEPSGLYLTEFLTDKAMEFIGAHVAATPEQPFFMYMSYTAPHAPMEAQASDIARVPMANHFANSTDNSKRQIYGAMVVSLDDNVGRLLNHLETLEISENTLVIFLSDNGGPGPSQNWSINNPLQGYKGDLWEGGIRVPFAICWPGVIPAGQIIGHTNPVCSVDLLPTFAAVSGADLVEEIRTDGKNLMPFLTQSVPEIGSRSFFWRRNDTNLITHRSGNYKYYYNRSNGVEGVWDLSDSYSDRIGNSILSAQPELTARLRAEYAAFEATVPDPAFKAGTKLFAITTYDLDEAEVGLPYNLTLKANNPSGQPLTWSIASGKPAWLNLDPSTGVLSGTPAVTDPYWNNIALELRSGNDVTRYTVPLIVRGSTNISPENWQSLYRIAGSSLTDDSDKDGIIDLFEYAFGSNPTIIDQVRLPSLEPAGVGTATARHVRRAGNYLDYSMETSIDLSVWSAVEPASATVSDLGDGFVEVSANLPVNPCLFTRVDIAETASQ